MKKTRCYIYTRVSTAIQVDGYSLDAQRDKLRKYAEEAGKLLISIIAAVAEMERENIRVQTMAGSSKKASQSGF